MRQKTTQEQLIELDFEKHFTQFLVNFPNFEPMETIIKPAMLYWFMLGFERCDYFERQKQLTKMEINAFKNEEKKTNA